MLVPNEYKLSKVFVNLLQSSTTIIRSSIWKLTTKAILMFIKQSFGFPVSYSDHKDLCKICNPFKTFQKAMGEFGNHLFSGTNRNIAQKTINFNQKIHPLFLCGLWPNPIFSRGKVNDPITKTEQPS